MERTNRLEKAPQALKWMFYQDENRWGLNWCGHLIFSLLVLFLARTVEFPHSLTIIALSIWVLWPIADMNIVLKGTTLLAKVFLVYSLFLLVLSFIFLLLNNKPEDYLVLADIIAGFALAGLGAALVNRYFNQKENKESKLLWLRYQYAIFLAIFIVLQVARVHG